MASRLIVSQIVYLLVMASAAQTAEPPRYQYQSKEILVPAASENEPILESVSISSALRYLENGALAWSEERKCISCHSNGTYMVVFPQISSRLGAPSKEMRNFFKEILRNFQTAERSFFFKETGAQQLIYLAAGLAEWDANVTGKLSLETDEALRLMLRMQLDPGGWTSMDCWPPLESSAYHAATIAARAVAVAPGWLSNLRDEEMPRLILKLRTHLRDSRPQHDYDRVSLLWTASRMDGLLTAAEKKVLFDMVLRRQRMDGGWSIRTFSKPEEWGSGNRAEKLRAERDFDNPPSDGHMTGLALIVLRDSGLGVDDARIQKGVQWLLRNQRQSGRWWTRSLNGDSRHLITYSGTAYPLLALTLWDALPKSSTN